MTISSFSGQIKRKVHLETRKRLIKSDLDFAFFCVYSHHTVAGDLANIILDPIFIFVFRLGVRGAAIAHVISQ